MAGVQTVNVPAASALTEILGHEDMGAGEKRTARLSLAALHAQLGGLPSMWAFASATADADPGSGLFRLNHATPASATAAYIDNEAVGAVDLSAWLDTFDDNGDSSLRGMLTISNPAAPTTVFRVYAVSGSVVDGTGYRKLTLAHVAGAGVFAAGVQHRFDFHARGPTFAGLTAVVDDPAPVLGGNLDADGNDITGVDALDAASATVGGQPVLTGGSHVVGYWPARALVLPVTTPAGVLAKAESTTNDVNDEYLPFANGSTTHAGFSFRAPESLDESASLSVEIEWMEAPAASAHVCRWQAEAQAQGDGDTIDAAWGTPVAADDTGSAGTRRFVTLAAVAPAGSWAAGDKIHVRIARLGGHANDTLDVAAHLVGVTVKATVAAGTD